VPAPLFAPNGRPVPPDRRIFTFTTVQRPFLPDASKADGAFTTVRVELDGPPGVRLVGRLVGGVDPTIGMRVIAKFTNDPDGGSSHQTDDSERLMPALLAETGLGGSRQKGADKVREIGGRSSDLRRRPVSPDPRGSGAHQRHSMNSSSLDGQ
jgi:hypothetical protein